MHCGSRRLATATVLALGLMGLALQSPASEPPVIENPALAPGGVQRVQPTELFRLGGEDAEIFFGNVGSIDSDDDGNLYILDSQLCETHIYAPDGELLRTIGGEGDGPGEVRSPNGMFRAGDGKVCILQGFPGKIVELASDGTPAGVTAHTVPGDQGGQFMALVTGQRYGDGMILAGIRMTFSGPGQSDNNYFLDICNRQGVRQSTLFGKTVQVNFSSLVMDEGATDFPWNRFASAPDGTIYAALARNDYAITVFEPDGSVRHVIRREYQSVTRNDQETGVARRIQEAIASNYPTPAQKILVEDTAPDISGMFVTTDGRLWVKTSRGDRESPEGCFTVLDVYDPDGNFDRQVALVGPHDAYRDGLTLLPDGRLLVVTSSLDSWLNQMGSVPDESEPESEPLEIICYRIEL